MKHYKYIAEAFRDMQGLIAELEAEEVKQMYTAVGAHIIEGAPYDDSIITSKAVKLACGFIVALYDGKVERQDEFTKKYQKNDGKKN